MPGLGAMSSVAQAELEIAELSLYHSSVKIIVPWPGQKAYQGLVFQRGMQKECRIQSKWHKGQTGSVTW